MAFDTVGMMTTPMFREVPPKLSAPSISDYIDFRKYLVDFYAFKRAMTSRDLRSYNYAMFSAAAGIKSPNYLKMIIEGRRNLSDDMVFKFAKALGLNKEQTDEFLLMVQYGQCSEPAERNMYLRVLSDLRVRSKIKSGEIDKKLVEKTPNWIGWILFAMADQEGVDFDLHNLKGILRGKASDDEVDQALQQLLETGRLVKDEATGKIMKSLQASEASEDIPPVFIRKLQAQLMYLGMESLFNDAPTEREFGSLTLSLTKPEFEELKFQLRKFRKSLNKDNSIARMSAKGERVYQLNIQLFPVTDTVKSSTKKS